jgi:hypothetical protein
MSRGSKKRRPLTTEEERAHFWQQEQQNAERWARLTAKQKRHPKWQRFARQLENSSVRLILMLAGEDLPAPIGGGVPETKDERSLGVKSGLFEPGTNVELGPTGDGTAWSSPWGSPWTRPKGER